MKGFSTKSGLVTLIIGVALALIYKLSINPIYFVQSEILLKRYVSPINGDNIELSKNRWVWVRDGLAIKKLLSSERVLSKIESQLNAKISTESLREKIKIDYTGGDENVFIIHTFDQNVDVAKNLNLLLARELQPLAIERVPVNELGQQENKMTEIVYSPKVVNNSVDKNLKIFGVIIIFVSLLAGIVGNNIKMNQGP